MILNMAGAMSKEGISFSCNSDFRENPDLKLLCLYWEEANQRMKPIKKEADPCIRKRLINTEFLGPVVPPLNAPNRCMCVCLDVQSRSTLRQTP